MPNIQKQEGETKESGATANQVRPPAINLPKGGGAIRGIGEKFAANPVTGTGSMTVPIATSPGRSGFGPQLSLSYDSGSGNGPFGFGWSLSLPSITRKTDKGLPRYWDAEESDEFILSGAEDLVPALVKKNGNWEREKIPPRTIDGKNYDIQRYRPRIEGLFARIERWTNQSDPKDTFWRSISKDNITTWYGKTENSRIFDPADKTRIFSSLICQSYDDKGNAIVYEYAEENSQRIFEDQHGQPIALAHERNRDDKSRSANRYLKRIIYGNLKPNRDDKWEATDPSTMKNADGLFHEDWMFEVVFDYLPIEEDKEAYGQHYKQLARDADGQQFIEEASAKELKAWGVRQDPFSSYKAGFEVRTYRLCRRVLMFHHFQKQLDDIADYLVRSTEFTYDASPIASFITGVTQSGYKYDKARGKYLKKSLPPLQFEYSKVPDESELSKQPVQEVDPESLENLPIGLDGPAYQWMDLDGEGTSGILTEQANAWFYKRNLSANNQIQEEGDERTQARFGPAELVAKKPVSGLAGGAQFLDLAGDGQVDLVQMDDPLKGFYERTDDADWSPFKPFKSFPNLNIHDPNLKFVDLTGDGHADILITENEAFIWYLSLGEEGFKAAERVFQSLDEESGPRLVFADGTQSIYLGDLSGDGLSDLVRIRNGEICYWPNLGYGKFGPKVTMDNAPWFDTPDQFDQRRIHLADIDGSGTTDIIYLRNDGVQIYFNQSGNRWSNRVPLPQFPPVDNLSSVQTLDLLGNGTACLVWSSSLPSNNRRPMFYVALMPEKPHLLTKTINNLGAETVVVYVPSTKFYLKDKEDGNPWITRLPFPVHVVERVETYDHISRNRFVTRYAYHHGYFDGQEREFRGFGMVEQRDTEEYATLTQSVNFPVGNNLDESSHVPPVLTKTWFHTGAYLLGEEISRHLAYEYYGAPDEADPLFDTQWDEFKKTLLPDTVLPRGIVRRTDGSFVPLTLEEEREACRALKGSMLRQEVYALDGTDKEKHPYTVTEQNFTIEHLQPRGKNYHTVFFAHPREALSYHYERNPVDPRVSHAMTLEVDGYGNVLKSLAIGYGRRQGQSPLQGADKDKQEQTLITYTENDVTKAIDKPVGHPEYDPDNYRTPLSCEVRTYEMTGLMVEYDAQRYSFDKLTERDFDRLRNLIEVPYEQPVDYTSGCKRLIERVRTLYRKDDLTALLPLGEVETHALSGESYKLAFTLGQLDQVYTRGGQRLLPANPADVLEGGGMDRGGYVDLDGDNHWWIPAGRVFLSPDNNDDADQELVYARQHFYMPHRYRDPFYTDAINIESIVTYDFYDLLMVDTCDAVGNRVTVGERKRNGDIDTAKPGNDYRVLQPKVVTDPNRNRAEVSFNALGLVAGTAVKGKDDTEGDTLIGFEPDLTQSQIDGFYDVPDPHLPASSLLKGATTRTVYDIDRYLRTHHSYPDDPTQWLPVYAATLARETHTSDPLPSQGLKIQISFSYSDGRREIQKKIQAEPGRSPNRDANGRIIIGSDGQPEMTLNNIEPRWVGSGWVVYNNKPSGKPVRQFEPFFSDTHRMDNDTRIGVSSILFYDPAERVIATLHPNHTYEKVIFDPWQQTTYDVNDTVILDPSDDSDVKGFFIKDDGTPRAPAHDYSPTWYALRTDPAYSTEFAALYPDAANRANQAGAARKAADHANTPTTAYFDTLGRPFLTVAHNKVVCPGHALDGTEDKFATRVDLDIEGNQRAVKDERKKPDETFEQRIVMLYDYDMLGNRIHQSSMEAGERWMLNDVAGKPIRAWDSRGHCIRTEYDPLRRPLSINVTGIDPDSPNTEFLTDRLVYGEQHPEDELRNLRGKIYLHLDQAGSVTNEACDFKGNPLCSTRRLTTGTRYRQAVDWRPVDNDHVALPTDAKAPLDPVALEAALASRLEAASYTSLTTYDALNRPVTLTTPHTPAMQPSVIRPSFNEANLLDKVDVNLRGSAATYFVNNLNYNAKGQREHIEYGCAAGLNQQGVTTSYEYDKTTFRLIHMRTTRPAGLNGLASQIFSDSAVVQDLHYSYDPMGNITHIVDKALKTVTYGGQQVDPVCDCTYDAIYRLIEAKGREHIGQTAFDLNPPGGNRRDYPFVGLAHPNDLQALRNYIERYEYDEVGNFIAMRHLGQWTRSYEYDEDSLNEVGKKSNRLTRTTLGNGLNYLENYDYMDAQGTDVHGCMTAINNMMMAWDFKDQLQQVDLGGGGIAYYVYDSSGQRVRKVIESQNGKRQKERIYLGGFEIYREYENDDISVKLERESLHVMDDKQRIALVDTLVIENRNMIDAPSPLTRYQLGNYLGSASLELDKNGELVSYEEYHPYGTTALQAGRSAAEVSLKRHRYTGKERDEESGLYYYGARYYANWLGRWCSCDPIGLVDGVNIYQFVAENPTRLVDKTGLQDGPPDEIEPGVPYRSWDPESPEHGGDPGPSDYPRLIDPTATQQEDQSTNPLTGARAVSISYAAFDAALRDLYKATNIERASAAVDFIEQLNKHGDVSTAGTVARSVSDLRNILRTATQGELEPVGKLLSALLEKNRDWQEIIKRYGDPFDPKLTSEARFEAANKIAEAAGRSAKAMNALQFVGKALMVLDVASSSWQIGGGVNQIIEGNAGEGAIEVGEGTTRLGLTIGTYSLTKAGVIVGEAGIAAGGLTVGAGIAAAGGIALPFEDARRAIHGEKTAAAEAANYYCDLIFKGEKQGGVSGFFNQFAGYLGLISTAPFATMQGQKP